MLMFAIALVLSAVAVVRIDGGHCSPCPQIPKHYEELGCVGHLVEGGCCPERFECPDLKSLDQSKCRYRGRSYEHGEDLDDSNKNICSANCKCLEHGGKASFNCASIECPDLFNPPQPECVSQHSLDQCCSTSTVCDPKEVAKLAKCNWSGKEYTQGNRIYPDSSPCYSCLCQPDFDNSTRPEDNPHCRKLDCGIELRNLNRFREGCVPVYFGENSCCPHEYRCPEDSDEVMPLEGRTDIVDDPKMVCTYNQLTLQRGQMLNSPNKCVKCTCKNPPMVECRQEPNC